MDCLDMKPAKKLMERTLFPKSAPNLTLIKLAKAHSPELRACVEANFDSTELKAGTVWAGYGTEFLFVVEAAAAPSLMIDEAAGPAMQAISGSNLWYALAHIQNKGCLHQFHWVADGRKFGGSLDVPAFGPLSYLRPGISTGKLSGKLIHTSKIYDGMKSEYWVYVPAQYDPSTSAAVMVFQDGAGYIGRESNNPALNVIDNLIAEKKIPVMICVFIEPGDISDSPGTPTYNFVKEHSEKWSRTLKYGMRSVLYDTVSDRYPRFLRDELLAEVGSHYNLRKDAYSRAITGMSSGAICSFNAAWQLPEVFSRVISWIGSFTCVQWRADPANLDGGQDYPEKVLREPHRNLRVWLQDGANDMENVRWGSWPMANLRMANALKTRGYDFHFSFGHGTHNTAHGAAEFPREMIWLWRDYDPAQTTQEFTMEPKEVARPFFRVAITNRDCE